MTDRKKLADEIIHHTKTEKEHKYTSTGVKFWCHPKAMQAYREGKGCSVISTHISPEGRCNLRCPYCSVAKRDVHNRISMNVIKDYVLKLKSRGLQAVIITGGGEPTLYPEFEDMVIWLKEEQYLSVALITNGTNTRKISQPVWDMFSWVRVSLNKIPNWREVISFPKIKGVLGSSMVYSGQSDEELAEIAAFVPDTVSYVRVLPNCLLEQDKLIEEHIKIEKALKKLDDNRFFHQFKIHGNPVSRVCHQAYFRPYLSEVDGGTVYPCDSLVLNEEQMHFAKQYAICSAENILDFLDRKIEMGFDASECCKGCVFSENIKLLDEWLIGGVGKFAEFSGGLEHAEFV